MSRHEPKPAHRKPAHGKPARGPRVQPVGRDGGHLAPFIFAGEAAADFDALRRRLVGLLRPADAIEVMLVDDLAHYAWEAARSRRLLLKHVASCEPEGLDALLASLGLEDLARRPLVEGFATRDPEALARAERLLAAAGHDGETVRARALALRVDEIGKLQELVGAAERRREKLLRELFAHRKRMERSRAPDDAPGDDPDEDQGPADDGADD